MEDSCIPRPDNASSRDARPANPPTELEDGGGGTEEENESPPKSNVPEFDFENDVDEEEEEAAEFIPEKISPPLFEVEADEETKENPDAGAEGCTLVLVVLTKPKLDVVVVVVAELDDVVPPRNPNPLATGSEGNTGAEETFIRCPSDGADGFAGAG